VISNGSSGIPSQFQPSRIGHKGPKVIIYIDNILLHSKTDQEHRAQLEKMLQVEKHKFKSEPKEV
jgi:hypothetical protein